MIQSPPVMNIIKISKSNERLRLILPPEAAAAAANVEIFERAKAEKEAAAANEPPKAPSTPTRKKPYYVRPKQTGERTYQKPVKKDSVESYYFDLQNSNNGLKREKEEPSDIAKACGIYEDAPAENNE